MAGPERKTRVMSEKEKRVIAYHEGGHALVGHVLEGTDPIHKVSIVARGRALGWTLALPTEDKYLHTRGRARRLDGDAARAAARPRSWCSASPPPAPATTSSAAPRSPAAMVTEYGMSDRLGPAAARHQVGRGVPRPATTGHEANYSDEVAGLDRRRGAPAHRRTPTTGPGSSSPPTGPRSTSWPRRWSRRRRSTTPTWPRSSATSTRAPASTCRSTSSSARRGRRPAASCRWT